MSQIIVQQYVCNIKEHDYNLNDFNLYCIDNWLPVSTSMIMRNDVQLSQLYNEHLILNDENQMFGEKLLTKNICLFHWQVTVRWNQYLHINSKSQR